jgi:pimeloyl-ACP methyl ester carboxylesterase
MSDKEPLLLLHGVSSSAAAWADVIPLVTECHQVIAPTAMGHRGGAPLVGKATVAAMTDEAERLLDARGLDKIHVAGNSLGGWMAIELARRGRADTVCAFSPAGFWTTGGTDETDATSRVRRARRLMQRIRPVAPFLLRFAPVRQRLLSRIAEHGDRLTPTRALDAMLDVLECTAASDLLTTEEWVAPLDPLPCPVTLAWGANDNVVPANVNGITARERLPHADFLLLPHVGHVPMIDNPQLCADTILTTTGAQPRPGAAA